MSKHTLGPWEQGRLFNGDQGSISANGRGIAMTHKHGWSEPDSRGWKQQILTPEDEANARLIKLAPEMLDELRQAAQQFRFYVDQHRAKNTKEGDEKALVNEAFANRIEALINKATGS